jgi:hypothetical protein
MGAESTMKANKKYNVTHLKGMLINMDTIKVAYHEIIYPHKK